MKFKIFKLCGEWILESPHGTQYEFGSFDAALMGFQWYDDMQNSLIPKNYGMSRPLMA